MLHAVVAKYHVLKVLSVLAIALVGYELLTLPLLPKRPESLFYDSASQRPLTPPQSPATLKFWESFTEALARGQPSFPEVRRKGDGPHWIGYHRHGQNDHRPDLIDLSEDEFKELQSLRKQAIVDMTRLAPDLQYHRGTNGIVTTAHPDAFGILTTSLWMLRAVGSKLPVEVWVYDRKHYDQEPCDVIFPALNARCMFMTDYLPETLEHPLKIVKFTFKPLAILFSSFQNVLFLDDDVFPVMNPDDTFDSEPFVTSRAVLWPDYWADTAAKEMYDLSHIEPPNLEERATTEAGQMLFDKSTHAAAILLATWFNTWGPEYWHRLASQGSPGEGDKDLWRFSVQAFGLPFYQVEERPQRVGYTCNERNWPIGTAQSHPNDDHKIASTGAIRDSDDLLTLGSSAHPRILFIHGNLPKLDPYLLLDWGRISADWPDVLRCDQGEGPVHRLYGPPELTVPKYGWDMEKGIWNAFLWMTCEHETGFRVWVEGSIWRPDPRHDLCDTFKVLWGEHFPGEEWSRTAPDPNKPVAPYRPWGGVAGT